MRRFLLSVVVLAGIASPARAQLVANPLIFPSASFVTGNCLQATGPTSVASTGAPCGSGAGAGNVTGPTSSTIGAIPVWSNGTGTGLADSSILAVNIPGLGADQLWGGANSYVLTPTFPTAALTDSSLFGATTAYVQGVVANYLTLTLAASTYLTQANAASTYLTASLAASTYLTQAHAVSTYVPLSGGTSTGVQTAPGYTLNAAPGLWRPISFNTSGSQRGQFGANNSGEGGANTGSDLDLFSYTDAGSVLQNVLHIPRATGIPAWVARPTFAGNLAWDAGNLNPAAFATPASVTAALVPYLKSADAASTYLTQANAAATYATPAQVTTALVPYLTNATAQQTYATIAGVQSAYLRISTARTTYMPFAGGAFTGPVTGITPATTDSSTTLTTTAMVHAAVSAATVILAPLNSPALVGAPTAPTQAASDNTNKIATDAYVTGAIATAVQKPYSIRIDFQGPANTVLGGNGYALHHVFARSVTCPDHFAGAQFQAANFAATSASFFINGPVKFGTMGTISVSALQSAGTFAVTSTGIAFAPGDVLDIIQTTTDTHLGGISIEIPCTAVN